MTIPEQIVLTFKDMVNITYTRKEIIDLVLEKYPKTNLTSIIPTDYCYNLVNKDKNSFNRYVFESLGKGNFKCLGENYPYSGEIYWKNNKVGQWVNGKPVLDTDPRKY